MACLVRTINFLSKPAFTEKFLKNNEISDNSDFIIETQESFTRLKIKNEKKLINISFQDHAQPIPQPDNSYFINKSTSKAFIETEEKYVTVWHLSQDNINAIIDYLDNLPSKL